MPTRFLSQARWRLFVVIFCVPFVHCGLFQGGIFPSDSSQMQAENESEAARIAAAAAAKPVEPAVQEPIKKRILVLEFANRTSYGGSELGESAAQDIRDRIEKVSGFLSVPESEMEPREELNRAVASYNYRGIFEKARAKGISGVVVGSIDSIQMQERGSDVGLFQTRYYTVQANVRYSFYDTSNEKLVFSHQTTSEVTEEHTELTGNRQNVEFDASKCKGAVSKALEKSYDQLVFHARRLAWAGKIAKIDMNRYFINAGETSGIIRGQLLKVSGEGFKVTDGETGTDLGVAPGIFKGVLKVVDYFGQDGSIAVIHSGAGFRENDRVEIYSPPPK